jgi:hypothetical protein
MVAHTSSSPTSYVPNGLLIAAIEGVSRVCIIRPKHLQGAKFNFE